MEKHHDKGRAQAASPFTPSPSEPQPADPVPAKADVYDPVGMAGQKAGIVEEMNQQQADGEHEPANGQAKGSSGSAPRSPAETETTTPAPDKADVYNPVGMAGQKAGVVEEMDQQLKAPSRDQAGTEQ